LRQSVSFSIDVVESSFDFSMVFWARLLDQVDLRNDQRQCAMRRKAAGYGESIEQVMRLLLFGRACGGTCNFTAINDDANVIGTPKIRELTRRAPTI
jgi:hypothetical protein